MKKSVKKLNGKNVPGEVLALWNEQNPDQITPLFIINFFLKYLSAPQVCFHATQFFAGIISEPWLTIGLSRRSRADQKVYIKLLHIFLCA